MPENESPTTRPRRRPASLACYECRRKHLKCDGAMPICVRCASAAINCTYLPSRRGLTGRQDRAGRQDRVSGNAGGQWRASTYEPDNSFPSPGSQHTGTDHAGSQQPRYDAASRSAGDMDSSSGRTHSSTLFSAAERSSLVGLYYSHFHRSHPMLAPRVSFSAQQYPDFLVVAACLVGHHFASSQPPESALPVAIAMAVAAGTADASHRIQAYILLALVSLGSHEMDRANECLDHAVALVTEVDLTSLDRSLQSDLPVAQRESLRRTWWELFAVDALLALLQSRPPKIAAQDPDTLPHVPRADVLYEAGDFSRRQPTFAEFERRIFLPQSCEFCSHFYRVEALLIVRRAQPLFTADNVEPQELEAVCNVIASWPYHLPDSSFALPDSLEDSDQILIQAHILVQVASIFLNLPRSSLPSSAPSAIDATCLSKGLQRMEKSTQHGTKAIAASKELCRIAATPFLQDIHSPMTICGFLLGSAVQLSIASHYRTHNPRYSEQCRHRIVVLLGALKQTGKAWASGRIALRRVQPFADAIFTSSNDNNSEDIRVLPGSNATATSVPAAEATTLEIPMNEQDLELNLGTTLQDGLSGVNWFDFFQSIDPSTDLSAYNVV